ncbi:unnamed protein product [Brassica oleracea]|uniref:(rape) hypothetical protein n=2 Tax=Brassica TaxID=3705 RepID=A0A816RT91_BRANA|nr:unnamed protein product [Brassica napus]
MAAGSLPPPHQRPRLLTHSSDYTPYPRLNPNDITPPMHAPISGATATVCCLSTSLTVLLPLPPRVSYLTFLSLKCRNGNDLRGLS